MEKITAHIVNWLNTYCEQNKMDGFGIMSYADGRRYEGFYVDDKRQGFGIYKYADGSEYSGYWYLNKQHGYGIYVKGSKSVYQCWKDGQKKCSLTVEQVQ